MLMDFTELPPTPVERNRSFSLSDQLNLFKFICSVKRIQEGEHFSAIGLHSGQPFL